MGASREHKGKAYKRSWKNLLLNKQYQLSFTLLMVSVSALLMLGLGYWVNREAARATEIFLNRDVDCRVAPAAVTAEPAIAPPAVAAEDPSAGTLAAEAPGDTASAPSADPPVPERERKPVVVTDIGEMQMVENKDADGAEDEDTVVPSGAGSGTLLDALNSSENWPVDPVCQKAQLRKRQELLDGQRFIFYVLVAVGLLLVFGLTGYGIKMTHKVAGPLFKVSLYMGKMKNGRLDTVYNLRKGDQLMDFYEHFKEAHGGLRAMQQEDIAQIAALLEAADSANLAKESPEIAAALDELRAIVARKEADLV